MLGAMMLVLPVEQLNVNDVRQVTVLLVTAEERVGAYYFVMH